MSRPTLLRPLNPWLMGATLLALGGCATPPDIRINPTRMHVAPNSPFGSLSSPSAPSVAPESVKAAEALPAARYFTAMNNAKTQESDGTRAQFIETGIGVVQAHCLRWFQRMSDQGLVKAYSDGNVNIIRQLGTALLGIGKANSIIVSTYGAGNTAYEGLSKNFDDSFLLAPNSRKVKNQIMGILDSEATKLRSTDKGPKNFDQAYVALERYADLCTHATAREIINDALDQGTAKIADDGKVRVEPSDKALQRASEDGRKAAVDEKLKAEAERDGLRSAAGATERMLKIQADLAAQVTRLTTQLSEAQANLAEERRRALPPAGIAPAAPASAPN